MTPPTSLSALICRRLKVCNLMKYGLPANINLLVMDKDILGKGEEEIASALSLALGIDPTEIRDEERATCGHLFNCLEEEFLTMFSHSYRSSVHKKGVKNTSILSVFCSCKRPENGFYFQCTGWRIWFHPERQNMAQEDISESICQAQ